MSTHNCFFAKSNSKKLLKNLFLTKNVHWKNGPSLILKKLDFFREIHNIVTPSIMEIDKIFIEMFLFHKVGRVM